MNLAAIGRYQISGEVGAGGFATVYRAHDPTLDRAIALKVLHPHLARDPEFRDRFIREGRSLARVHHPNLVQVYDAGESDGFVYLAMQFIPGHSLAELARARQMPLAELAPIVAQVAAALAAIHAAGLVHRDVKPANILVTDEGRAVLLDLGIARDVNSSTVTASGLIVGTPGYLAPEQVDSSVPVGPHTDIYQLGATVYALLAGRPPFEGDTAQVLYGVVHRAPPDLGDLRPDLPPPVIATIAEAMAKDPFRRPPGAPAFAAALASGSGATAPLPAMEAPTRSSPPVPEPTLTAVHPAAPPPRRRNAGFSGRAWLLAGAAAIVLALLGGGVLLARGRGDGTATDSATAAAGDVVAPAGGDATATTGKGEKQSESGFSAGGAPVTLTIAKGDEQARVPFEGKTGQLLALGVTRVTVGPGNPRGAYISVLDPDGRALVNRVWVDKDGGAISLPALRSAGTYAAAVIPEKDGAGSVTLTLSQPVTGTLAVDGQPFTVALERPGQYGRLTVDGKRDQFLSLGVTKVTIGAANPNGVYVSLLDPDGRPVVDRHWVNRDGGAIAAPALRAAGTYTVVLDPDRVDTGGATLTLSQPVTGTLATDGSPTTTSIERPGQYARLSFDGRRDQLLSLGVDRVTVGAANPNGVYISVLDPDGKEIVDREWVNRDGETIRIPRLRAGGSHVVLVEPDSTHTGKATLTLSQPVTATLTTDGTPATVEIARAGQHGLLTFEGRQGQDLTVAVTRAALGAAGRTGVRITIVAPEGKRLFDRQWVSRDGGSFSTKPLPVTGTYVMIVEPERTDTGSVTVALKQTAAP
jgi:hypothetical protein